ncbi:hypothetical protein O6H91_Y174800 [Diphasiastrum complanatum]|nr:hypothetical protein O6H91_Y174800 [Diphasiastrum complanatum]
MCHYESVCTSSFLNDVIHVFGKLFLGESRLVFRAGHSMISLAVSLILYCLQVVTAGDLCAICQEKMHTPIALRCKHLFCEDCVSEWFERERTCPLCRAVVKSADLRSFGDGSTCLFVQIF